VRGTSAPCSRIHNKLEDLRVILHYLAQSLVVSKARILVFIIVTKLDERVAHFISENVGDSQVSLL
jgi:hypothetical protein